MQLVDLQEPEEQMDHFQIVSERDSLGRLRFGDNSFLNEHNINEEEFRFFC